MPNRCSGLRLVERVGTTAYLTCNERHHELELMADTATLCDHLAIEYATSELLADVVRRAQAAGHEVWSHQEPGVEEAWRIEAPGGFVFEVLTGMATGQPRYATEGVRPRKFEHITLKSTQKDALEAFATGVLGLRPSDRAGDRAVWMRAGTEHHGLSIFGDDVDQLQHYAWQADGWDAIRRIGDRLHVAGRTFLWGPGHHGIGDNYFGYFLDLDGAIVEYSADIVHVENEAAHVVRTWPDEPLTVNVWGNPELPQQFADGGVPLAVHRRSTMSG